MEAHASSIIVSFEWIVWNAKVKATLARASHSFDQSIHEVEHQRTLRIERITHI